MPDGSAGGWGLGRGRFKHAQIRVSARACAFKSPDVRWARTGPRSVSAHPPPTRSMSVCGEVRERAVGERAESAVGAGCDEEYAACE
eukprot:5556817-Pleurochrysis_carterae.AAC.4